MDLHPDFRDLLSALADSKAEYLIVGGWAVGFHSEPRFTKDLDILIGDSDSNLEAVVQALERFGAPRAILEALQTLGPDEFLFLGTPPLRVDILRRIGGVLFSEAFARRENALWDDVPVFVIGFDDLLAAKRSAGRERDLRDIKALELAARVKPVR